MAYNTQLFQYAMLMQASSSATMSATTAIGTNGKAVTAGVSYTAFAYFLALSTPRNCTVGIQWYNAAGSTISTATSGSSADNTSTWIQVMETAVAPAGAVTAAVIVTVTSPANTEQHLVDSVSLAVTSEFSASYFVPNAGPGGVHQLRELTYNVDGSLATVA